jgi:ABC-2 type transport system permease protein
MILILTRLYRAWRRRQGDKPERASGRAPAPVKQSPVGPTAASRGPLALVAHQVAFDLRASLRNPRARFFTFFFPVLLLVIFAGVFGHGTTTVDGVTIKLSRYYVPGILTMSIITAAYGSLVISMATARETGVLKRRRSTPVPPTVLVAGQALSTVAIAAIMGTVLLVVAKVGYGVGFAPGALVAVGLTALIGTVAFACLGYAVSGMIGSMDAAQPIVQLTTMPLYFISGVWIPTHSLGSTLRSLASVFPIEHLAAALHLASVHGSFTGALSPTDLLVLGAWALGAVLLAAWRFSWLPSAATA